MKKIVGEVNYVAQKDFEVNYVSVKLKKCKLINFDPRKNYLIIKVNINFDLPINFNIRFWFFYFLNLFPVDHWTCCRLMI